MIKKIGELAKDENCVISLKFGPDGPLTIEVYHNTHDFIIIGWNWSEETIMDTIKDTIRRAKEKEND